MFRTCGREFSLFDFSSKILFLILEKDDEKDKKKKRKRRRKKGKKGKGKKKVEPDPAETSLLPPMLQRAGSSLDFVASTAQNTQFIEDMSLY